MQAGLVISEMFLKSFSSIRANRLLKLARTLTSATTSPIVNKPVNLNTAFRSCATQFHKTPNEDLNYVEPNDFLSQDQDELLEREKKQTFEEIANGNPEIKKKLKIIDFEIKMFRDQMYKVPKKLTKSHYEELLDYETVEKRLKFLNFLFTNERRKENDGKKKVDKIRLKHERLSQLVQEGHNEYRVGESSMFIRIYSKATSDLLRQRQLAAQMHSQKIVFDCSYDEYMSRFTSKECAYQLAYCYYSNCLHHSPFGVSMCSYNPDSYLFKTLLKTYPVFKDISQHPWDFHEKSYLDLFPRDKLVYLTPHTKEDLMEWDNSAIYIIGTYVDKGKCLPVSKVKAQRQNIKMARLPLDKFVKWKQGSKALPLNTVLSVLLDFKMHKDWNIAFQNLPTRKIHGFYADMFA